MGTNFSSLLFSIDRQLTLTPLLHVVTQDMVFGWIVSCYKEVAVRVTPPLSSSHLHIFFKRLARHSGILYYRPPRVSNACASKCGGCHLLNHGDGRLFLSNVVKYYGASIPTWSFLVAPLACTNEASAHFIAFLVTTSKLMCKVDQAVTGRA